MPNNPWNKDYLKLSGTPNVSEPTTFEVKVTGTESSEEWYYKSHGLDGVYSSYNTAITLVVGTPMQLGSTGVYIEFTRPSASTYTPGDKWVFSTEADVQLNTAVGQFDYIETIDIDDKRDLLAISSSTGKVAIIEDIDSDTPMAVSSELTIGSGSVGQLLDFEKRNKELYVAKGRDNHPQFLGYSKNNGFDGVGEFELRSNPALDTLEGASNPQTDAYDMSVMLRAGGGANTKDARIIAGIKNVSTSGGNANAVYVQNLHTGKLYTYGFPTAPISIKRWYGKMHGDYCDGFAILRLPDDGDGYAGNIDLWTLNTAAGGTVGQQANMYQSIKLKKPSGEETLTQAFGDFYIVPQTSEWLKWFIVVSKSRNYTNGQTGIPVRNYKWLWKSDDITTADLTSEGFTIESDGWDNIDPQINNEGASGDLYTGGNFYYMQRCLYGGPQSITGPGGQTYAADMPDFVMVNSGSYSRYPGIAPHIMQSSQYSPLCFAGFETESGGYGTNPMMSYTAQIGPSFDNVGYRNWYNSSSLTPTQRQINTGVAIAWDDEQNDAQNQTGWYTEAVGPFMSNSSGNAYATNYRPVSWITFMIQIKASNSGEAIYKGLHHMKDWADQGTLAAKWKSFKGNNSFQLPNWLLTIENVAGEGELDKTSSSAVNKGISKIGQVPSKSPIFGINGRIIFSTKGATRRRHLLHYVRPGNRMLYTFRYGTESGMPQVLNDKSIPTLFPNSWLQENSGIQETDYQTLSAYGLWNENDSSSAFSSSFFGSAANAFNFRRQKAISGNRLFWWCR